MAGRGRQVGGKAPGSAPRTGVPAPSEAPERSATAKPDGCDSPWLVQKRSRRRRSPVPHVREPFYGVVDPHSRTVYVNDPTNIAGVGALLDTLLDQERRKIDKP